MSQNKLIKQRIECIYMHDKMRLIDHASQCNMTKGVFEGSNFFSLEAIWLLKIQNADYNSFHI